MRLKTDSKRQAILAAAQDVFREHGYANASMAAVGERIGASKATLYRYFASKEELFLAALLESAADSAPRIFASLAGAQPIAPALRRFAVRYLTFNLAPDVLAMRRVLIAEGARSGLGQRLYDRGPLVTWSKLAERLGAEMAAGRLRDEDPWLAAMHLRGLLEADLVSRALLGAAVDHRAANLKRHADKAVSAFLRAYAGREGGG